MERKIITTHVQFTWPGKPGVWVALDDAAERHDTGDLQGWTIRRVRWRHPDSTTTHESWAKCWKFWDGKCWRLQRIGAGAYGDSLVHTFIDELEARRITREDK